MTAHNVGDRVRSLVNAQKLIAGSDYTVVDAIESVMIGSNYVTYVLQDDAGDRFAVCNGHLILDQV